MMLPIPFVECIWDWNFLKGNESSSLLSHNPPFCFEVLCLLLLFLCFLDSVGREVYSLSVSFWNSMWVKGLGFGACHAFVTHICMCHSVNGEASISRDDLKIGGCGKVNLQKYKSP